MNLNQTDRTMPNTLQSAWSGRHQPPLVEVLPDIKPGPEGSVEAAQVQLPPEGGRLVRDEPAGEGALAMPHLRVRRSTHQAVTSSGTTPARRHRRRSCRSSGRLQGMTKPGPRMMVLVRGRVRWSATQTTSRCTSSRGATRMHRWSTHPSGSSQRSTRRGWPPRSRGPSTRWTASAPWASASSSASRSSATP